MQAIIAEVNHLRGMYAAKIIGDEGTFVILELLESEPLQKGDRVEHVDFYSMGSETYYNITNDQDIDVFVQNICGISLIRSQCFLTD